MCGKANVGLSNSQGAECSGHIFSMHQTLHSTEGVATKRNSKI